MCRREEALVSEHLQRTGDPGEAVAGLRERTEPDPVPPPRDRDRAEQRQHKQHRRLQQRPRPVRHDSGPGFVRLRLAFAGSGLGFVEVVLEALLRIPQQHQPERDCGQQQRWAGERRQPDQQADDERPTPVVPFDQGEEDQQRAFQVGQVVEVTLDRERE